MEEMAETEGDDEVLGEVLFPEGVNEKLLGRTTAAFSEGKAER